MNFLNVKLFEAGVENFFIIVFSVLVPGSYIFYYTISGKTYFKKILITKV